MATHPHGHAHDHGHNQGHSHRPNTYDRAFLIGIALNTGFDRDLTETIIRALRWSTLADVVVTGDDVERGRPAPDLIRRAMVLSGVDDPARVANVGDTSLDLQAGDNAGVGLNIGVWSGAHPKARLLLAPHTHLVEFAHEVVGIV